MSSSSTTTEPTVRETPEVSGDDNANARAAVHSANKPGVVPEFLRTLVFARPRGDDQFADCTFSPSLDMSR